MKIFKSKKMTSVWGSQEPQELFKVVAYLHSQGFNGPIASSTLHNLFFERPVDDDLSLSCSISRAGEWPEHVFKFCCGLSVRSKFLFQASEEINFYGNTLITPPMQDTQSIFSIQLEHLVWNEKESDINPSWKISTLPGYDNTCENWVSSWDKHFAPIIDSIKNLSEVIKFLEQIAIYKKNPWVKSDGYGSHAFDPYLAILLVKNNQIEAAKVLLCEALKTPKNSAVYKQLDLTLAWVQSRG
jgi:hypothetical protein